MSINICGVEYSVNGTIRLDLMKDLKEIPDSVFELVNLKTLNLSCNRLTEIPIEINKLVNLNMLNLSCNKLMEISNISGLVNLETLYLGHNELTTVPDISGLANLKTLCLDCNELTSIPRELCDMKNLEYVELSYNCIYNEESMKMFENLRTKYRYMSDQKQLIMSSIILPMVII